MFRHLLNWSVNNVGVEGLFSLARGHRPLTAKKASLLLQSRWIMDQVIHSKAGDFLRALAMTRPSRWTVQLSSIPNNSWAGDTPFSVRPTFTSELSRPGRTTFFCFKNKISTFSPGIKIFLSRWSTENNAPLKTDLLYRENFLHGNTGTQYLNRPWVILRE